MNKKFFYISTIPLFLLFGLGIIAESSYAAPSSWGQFTGWFKAKPPAKPYWINGANDLPSALIGAAYTHKIDLAQWVRDDSAGQSQFSFEWDGPHPAWLQISADGLYLEGNQLPATGEGQVQIKVKVKNLNTKQVGNSQVFNILLVAPVKEPVVVSPLLTGTEKLTPAENETSLPHNFAKPQSVSTTAKTQVTKPIAQTSAVAEKTVAVPEAPQWQNHNIALPAADSGAPYPFHIDLNEHLAKTDNKQKFTFILDKRPNWLQLNSDGKTLEGNANDVVEKDNQISFYIRAVDGSTKQSSENAVFSIDINQANVKPKWVISEFPSVAIAQKNYADINLNDYVTNNLKNDRFTFSLTPGKTNPTWIQLTPKGQLKLLPNKISLEDQETTQIIYLTATSHLTHQTSAAEITIQITANDNLPAPQWVDYFKLDPGIVDQSYSVNLGRAINLNALPEQDQLIFQIVQPKLNWLGIAENGYILFSKKIPESAIGKTYPVTLRVTSKMGGKSSEFHGEIFVNEKPKPLQFTDLPPVTLNKNYMVDLTDHITSNIKGDRFIFRIDSSTRPNWLSFQNTKILTGTIKDPNLLLAGNAIDISAISELTGLVTSAHLKIPFTPIPEYAPQWQTNILPNAIAGDNFKSDDLLTKINKRFANDVITIQYTQGPEWLTYNADCHCLISPAIIDPKLIGKTFTIELEALSKISGQKVKYTQPVKVYSGIPNWKSKTIPDVKIGQQEPWEISLNNMIATDPFNDKFAFVVDPFLSPKWIRVIQKDNQSYLVINSKEIEANEVDTVQTVRLIAGSQNTGKTSTQLFIVNVKPNRDLPAPSLKQFSLPEATVGVTQTTDILPYIRSLPKDSIRILLAPNSPDWLQIKNNKLISTAPLSAIGDAVPINLLLYSQASDKYSVLKTQLNAQLMLVDGDNMESHVFYDNHISVVVRGLEPNKMYRLAKTKVDRADYGPFYSSNTIKTSEDWENSPFYTIGDDKLIKTGNDGTVSLIFYNAPNQPTPQIDYLILK